MFNILKASKEMFHKERQDTFALITVQQNYINYFFIFCFKSLIIILIFTILYYYTKLFFLESTWIVPEIVRDQTEKRKR